AGVIICVARQVCLEMALFCGGALGLFLWGMVGVGQAATRVDVVKSGAVKVRIEVQGFTGTRSSLEPEFRRILENDLVRSGWFSLVRGGEGSLLVGGGLAEYGEQLRVECQVTAPGRVYLNREFRNKKASLCSLAHEVADAIVLAVKGVPGIAGTRILMIGKRGGRSDLYVCDADGNNLMQLTPDGVPCLYPAWGYKGQEVFYTTFLRGYPDVYRIDLATRRRTVLVNQPGMNGGAALSPDGRSLALVLSRDGNPELYVMDMGTKRLTRLTRTLYAAEASPTWAPDGKRLAYVSDRSGAPQIYVLNLETGEDRCITFRGSQNVAPDWGPAPDGRVAYSSRREGRFCICVWHPQTGEDMVLTTDGSDYEDPSWAPDGRHIVCSRSVGNRREIYVVDLLGDPPIRLFQAEGDWYSPTWSPR
ncbi:MAG: DPP IV N-terminal domain-containing protein, partial [Kiritimatiellae bacterium]|nr:DPP IV N-terminal domain-containing protein [Kiritimatiellia bacterium]